MTETHRDSVHDLIQSNSYRNLKMSNTKLLKIIDWFIDVPEVSGVDEIFDNKTIRSSIFDVEFDHVKTQWRLSINFNRKHSNNMVYGYV